MPVAHLTGVVVANGEEGDFRITLRPAAAGGHRDDIDVIAWSWETTDAGGRAGQHFVTEVRHFLISPDACAS